MQNTTASHPSSGNTWATPNLPNTYNPTGQRSTSNPRAYATPDVTADQGRRDDTAVYADSYNYQQQQQQTYPNVAYNSYGGQMNYATPNASRRTSGPKTNSTPPASAPVNAASPYATSYQPTSAPPQAGGQQPQTAHPYGGGYYNYYDQQQGQWSQYPVRPPTSTTPQSSYDYSQYPGYDRNWQAQAAGRAPTSNQWSGYPQGQYGWPQQQTQQQQQQQQQPQQWFPPVTPHSAQPVPSKKEKKAKTDDYKGLGKRSADPIPAPEVDDAVKSKKKVKEEKPVPKPPAKSHLHPPRQAQSAWQLFFTDELNKAKAAAAQGNSPGGTPHHAKLNVAQIAKDAGIAYANLNTEQKAYYAEKVQESKDQYAKELIAWQATLTPEDIRAENAFRAQQRKEGKSRKGNLKDPNAPKKPLSAYFLFLKGIREDDALRARVWGEESETTKQSVLAAERWRSLSDDEKRPFLGQAEKDKQDYEAARKIYEDDAAAKARGEDVPDRPPPPEPAQEVPKPVIRDVKAESAALVADVPFSSDNNEFQSFSDPLEGMDLGFQNVTEDDTSGGQEGEWGVLTNLMGSGSDKDVSVAPTLDEADKTQDVDEGAANATPGQVLETAAAAEGEASSLQLGDGAGGLGEATISAETSGVPTEEVGDLPATDLPLAVDGVTSSDGPDTSASSDEGFPLDLETADDV